MASWACPKGSNMSGWVYIIIVSLCSCLENHRNSSNWSSPARVGDIWHPSQFLVIRSFHTVYHWECKSHIVVISDDSYAITTLTISLLFCTSYHCIHYWQLNTSNTLLVACFPISKSTSNSVKNLGARSWNQKMPRNVSPDAAPARPGQCIWVLDDPIVRGRRFKLQCRAPKENLSQHQSAFIIDYPYMRS